MNEKDIIMILLKEKYELTKSLYLIRKELEKLYEEYHNFGGKELAYPMNPIVKCLDLADSILSIKQIKIMDQGQED